MTFFGEFALLASTASTWPDHEQNRKKEEKNVIVEKDSKKLASNDPRTFGIGDHFAGGSCPC